MKMEYEVKVVKEVRFENVKKVYQGKPGRCMCGCSGNYVYPEKGVIQAAKDRGYDLSPKEISDSRVKKRLSRFFGWTGGEVVVHECLDGSVVLSKVIGRQEIVIYLKKEGE